MAGVSNVTLQGRIYRLPDTHRDRMPNESSLTVPKGPPKLHDKRRWRWILLFALIFLVGIAIAGGIMVERAEPILRARIIETLSTRFKSKVELDSFHVSAYPELKVTGSGLRIFGQSDPNSHQPGTQPIIGVMEFQFHTSFWNLFQSPMHVGRVYVKGLQLNLPPKGRRSEMSPIAPKAGRIEIIIDSLDSDTAQLVINTEKPGKLPLVFAIQHLNLTRVGPSEPMHFEADLLNPKPVGSIHSRGSFGPWQAESPRDTPVQGEYSFSNADLSTIKGIGGVLSSTGQYAGTLDHITVDGATDTPDFRIAIADRPVPLHTDFHAIVDGTSGDTYLQPVKAKLLNTVMTANGSIVRNQQLQGHHIVLSVIIKGGKIDDLLHLALKTDPPMMTGAVQLHTEFDLPPGEPDMADRLRLAGNFQVAHAHFSDRKIQDRVDSLSLRSQGKTERATDNIPDNVQSDLGGTFQLGGGHLSFSRLQYRVPGAEVNLTGQYDLNARQFDFHGKARMEAKLSQMVGGWKSILLKPVDPFYHKNGAGTELPISITGTKSDLQIGVSFIHKHAGRKGKG